MLNDSDIRSAKPSDKPYKLTDSNGLHLEIKTNGVRAWRYRYRIGGKENLYAIGNYPEISLKEARKLRDAARALVVKHIHPSRQRRLETLARESDLNDTVTGITREWIAHNDTKWSEGYKTQLQARMEQDVFPWIGKLPIKDVKPAHVLDVLRRVEKRSPVQAKAVQTWLGGMFKYAVINLRRDDNPALGLRGAVKKVDTTHHAGMKSNEIGGFLKAIDSADGDDATKAAIALLWLTATRVNEVVGARWDEIDLGAGLWTIPASRMKAKKEHIIPLSDQAITLLASMKPYSGTLDHVFPQRSDRSKHMGRDAIRKLFIRAGYEGIFTPHGARGTFSTVANESRWRSDVIELCLAHGEPDKTRAAYNAALLIDERRELLQWWADLCDSLKAGGEVVPFRKTAA